MSEKTTTEPRDFDAELAARDKAIAEGFLPAPTSEPEPGEPNKTIALATSLVETLGEEIDQQKENETAELREDLLGLAITAYEDGAMEAQEIADFLLEKSPQVAGEFANYWYAQEEAEEPDDVLPSEWALGRRAQIEREAQLANQAEMDKQTEAAMSSAHKALHAAHPSTYARLKPLMEKLGAGMVVDRPEQATAKVNELFRLAGVAAAAPGRVERIETEVYDEFESLGDIDPADPIWNQPLGVNGLDPEQIIAERVNATLRDETLGVMQAPISEIGPSQSEQIHHDLFADTEIREAGWNVGKSDIGARQTEEYAKKKGLSPLDPKVQQYGRKRGWIR